MAIIDRLIGVLAQRDAERAVLVGDQPIEVFANGRKLQGAPVPHAQLHAAVAEITPDDLQPLLVSGGSFQFPYASPDGLYEIHAESDAGTLKISVVRSAGHENSGGTIPLSEGATVQPSEPPPASIDSPPQTVEPDHEPLRKDADNSPIGNAVPDTTPVFDKDIFDTDNRHVPPISPMATTPPGTPSTASGNGMQTQEVAAQLKAASRNAFKAFSVFSVNPTGGLAAAFESLEQRRALEVGIIFALFFDLCFMMGLHRILRGIAEAIYPLAGQPVPSISLFKLFIMGLVPFVCIAAASAVARAVFRGEGSFEGDVFIAGASLLPSGFFLLLAGLLGAANAEVVVALSVFSLCYTILIMHTGCTRISKIPEGASAVAVPLMLITSMWLWKIVLTAG